MKFKLSRQDNNLLSEIIEDDNVNNNIIPIEQQGRGTLNSIKIDENALNKNILKIRYLNGRKLNNKLLKHDYKISKKYEGQY